MAYEMRENTGSLFKNDYKTEGDNKPDYKGKCLVNGKEMEMAAWLKESNGKKFMSFSFSEPYKKDGQNLATRNKDDEVASFPSNPIAQSLSDLITAKQIGMIRALSREIGIDSDEECNKVMKCRVDKLSKRSAASLIHHLQDLHKTQANDFNGGQFDPSKAPVDDGSDIPF